MLTKVIFVKDSEPFPYEFDGIFGDFMDGIRENIESGKLDPENITSILSSIGQEKESTEQPGTDKMRTATRFIAGDPHDNLAMIAEAIAFYARRSVRPEVVCGLVCDSAMDKCRTFDTQDARIILPDKRIIH